MARTGLRMMPTFPSPPLKFRTVSFPQYGFKASLSDPTCPSRPEVKPAPGIPSGPRWFAMVLRALMRYTTQVPPVHSPIGQSGVVFAHRRAADPRGPWLRTGLSCPGPSSLTTTPSASLAGTRGLHGVPAYTPGLRCAGAPRRPARPSLLSLPCFPHVPPTLPRWVRCALPLSGTAIPGFLELLASRHPHPRLCQQSPTGNPFEAASFASCCGPCVCPALLAGSDGRGVPLPLSEVPRHPRFWHRPSPGSAGGQARWANGKSPIVGTFTRPVTTGSEAAQ
jgi:hypothetical protein